MSTPVPVIIDTDIGTDIDDTWALALALRSPELDVLGVCTVAGPVAYRARVAGALLRRLGRSEVPVAPGVPGPCLPGEPQRRWADRVLDGVEPPTHPDAVELAARLILEGPEGVTIVAMGPLTNLAELVRRHPEVTARARVVAMAGSIRVGYRGTPQPAEEYNVACDPAAARAVLEAPWPVEMVPLDTCGDIRLDGDRWHRMLNATDPVAVTVVDAHRDWLDALGAPPDAWERRSTVLYDTLAVHCAHDPSPVIWEKLRLRVTDRGATVPDGPGPHAVATGWSDREGFLDELTARLTGGPGDG